VPPIVLACSITTIGFTYVMTGGAVSAPLDDVAPHTLVLNAYPYGQLGSVDVFDLLTFVSVFFFGLFVIGCY
jgi:hypothetical protein